MSIEERSPLRVVGMFRVLIDTSIWFNIAEDPKKFFHLAVVEELIRRGRMSLIVPQLAIDEFKRNRARIADKRFGESNNHFRSVRQAIEKVGIPGGRQRQVLEYLDYVAQHAPTEGGGAMQVLERIERLLMAEPVVDTPPALE